MDSNTDLLNDYLINMICRVFCGHNLTHFYRGETYHPLALDQITPLDSRRLFNRSRFAVQIPSPWCATGACATTVQIRTRQRYDFSHQLLESVLASPFRARSGRHVHSTLLRSPCNECCSPPGFCFFCCGDSCKSLLIPSCTHRSSLGRATGHTGSSLGVGPKYRVQ